MSQQIIQTNFPASRKVIVGNHTTEADTTTIPVGLWRFYPQNFEIDDVSDNSVFVKNSSNTKIIDIPLIYSSSPIWNFIQEIFLNWTYQTTDMLVYSDGSYTIGQQIDTAGVNLVSFDFLLIKVD